MFISILFCRNKNEFKIIDYILKLLIFNNI